MEHKIPERSFKVGVRARGGSIKRHERQYFGISARTQRRRRVAATFMQALGTRRGLRKYFNLLGRADVQVVNPGDRCAVIPGHLMAAGVERGRCAKHPNRAERRWLERWWKAESEAA
jgi:hypothetical protein